MIAYHTMPIKSVLFEFARKREKKRDSCFIARNLQNYKNITYRSIRNSQTSASEREMSMRNTDSEVVCMQKKDRLCQQRMFTRYVHASS